ncbi:recombinase family protein [Lysinibacillus sphaericus]|uniref:recombinase family protein n=1 Tax=Lysinibacillus sphaericus TaxID=1421 RepID=UPI0018CF2595|nr:recombinase family protein [Lysinibacillus sphaericus]MBG9479380.1 resolvase [Lysinibacillus sphaericus]MBG9479429.1 resolvase [Lysinibacillus sphaericus]
MKYGYARVSTIHQDLESQLQQLENENCDVIYNEKISGTKKERPEFQKLINVLNEGDTLVVTKVDRFARNTKNALEIIQDLFNRNIRVHILNMGIIENTPSGKLIFSIFSAFAEFERDMIVERTQEGKAIAKQKEGFSEGRPKKYTKKQLDHAMQLKDSGMSYKQISDVTGISKSTLTREYSKRKNCI